MIKWMEYGEVIQKSCIAKAPSIKASWFESKFYMRWSNKNKPRKHIVNLYVESKFKNIVKKWKAIGQ